MSDFCRCVELTCVTTGGEGGSQMISSEEQMVSLNGSNETGSASSAPGCILKVDSSQAVSE